MPHDDEHETGTLAGLTGSGKGSARWRPRSSAQPWAIDDGRAALLVATGRTRRRPLRLGSWLRLPSRRRSRTEGTGETVVAEIDRLAVLAAAAMYEMGGRSRPETEGLSPHEHRMWLAVERYLEQSAGPGR